MSLILQRFKFSNDNPLSKHPLVEEQYNKYAEKTVETIALQDIFNQARITLFALNREAMRIFIKILKILPYPSTICLQTARDQIEYELPLM